jgi:sugar lactone lactonase YvrE
MVDHLGQVYVADSGNHRIMCWSKGSRKGRIIVGGNGVGEKPNQFFSLKGLSVDGQGDLYVVDDNNHRVQKFKINLK